VTFPFQGASQIATRSATAATLATALAVPLFLFAYWLNSVAVTVTPLLSGDANIGRLGLTGPFTLFVICVTLFERNATIEPAWRWVMLGFALLTLPPSSLIATLGLAGYGLFLMLRSPAPVRLAGGCLVVLATTMIWGGIGRTLFAAPLLSADAMAVEVLLTWFGATPARNGNIVTLQNGHGIIIFADCATAFLLLPTLALSAVLGLRDATRINRRFVIAMASLCVAATAVNLLRLCLLVVSAEVYAVGHGPIGQNIFDAALIGLAAAAAYVGRDKLPDRAAKPEPTMYGASPRWLALLLAIVVVGFGLKLVRYTAPVLPGDDHARATLTTFLESHGWRFDRYSTLVQSTGYAVMVFSQDGCSETISASLLSAEGESVDAVRIALPRAVFFYGGALLFEPSRAAAIGLWVDAATSAIGLRPGFPMPALALSPPPPLEAAPCAPPPIAAWASLRRR
jgi:hypothetical protein